MIPFTFSRDLSNDLVKYMDSVPVACEEGRIYFRACAKAICKYMEGKEDMEAQTFLAPEPYAAIVVRGTVIMGWVFHQFGIEGEGLGNHLLEHACSFNEEFVGLHVADMNKDLPQDRASSSTCLQ